MDRILEHSFKSPGKFFWAVFLLAIISGCISAGSIREDILTYDEMRKIEDTAWDGEEYFRGYYDAKEFWYQEGYYEGKADCE